MAQADFVFVDSSRSSSAFANSSASRSNFAGSFSANASAAISRQSLLRKTESCDMTEPLREEVSSWILAHISSVGKDEEKGEEKGEEYILSCIDEDGKRVLGIIAGILVARHLKTAFLLYNFGDNDKIPPGVSELTRRRGVTLAPRTHA
jgi:hypothetical protein